MEQAMDTDAVLADTRRWIERAVLGLELCPFARQPLRLGRVRFRVSAADQPEPLLRELAEELLRLRDTPASDCETTLLIHPRAFAGADRFEDFNDFLGLADALVEELQLDGELQVASFHPGYRFADVAGSDPANYSNRSPHPILHLLREDSVSRAVEAFPDPDEIVERNIETLERLGVDGFQRLLGE